MTRKLGPALVAADLAPRRLQVAVRGSAKSSLRRNDVRLVAVEEILFAEMDDPDLVGVFADAEIDRLAAVFGLTAEEVAELYRPVAVRPAAAGGPLRRRGRLTRAR
jgi:hypothetical protein